MYKILSTIYSAKTNNIVGLKIMHTLNFFCKTGYVNVIVLITSLIVIIQTNNYYLRD